MNRIERRATAETLLMVAAVTGLGLAAQGRIPASAMDLLYLVPVAVAARLHGLGQGVIAGTASALAYNFFFVPPVYTLRIDDSENIVTVVALLAVAVFTSRLTAQLRSQAREAQAAAARNAALASFARQLAGSSDEAALAHAICTEAARIFAADALVVLRGHDVPLAAAPPFDRLAGLDLQAAQQCIESGGRSGRGTATLQAADWSFVALPTPSGVVGALGLARGDGRAPVDGDDPLLASIAAQAALALERAALARELNDVAALRERDRLRGALLSSVGHDLRTPLTAILAASAELRATVADAALVATLDSEARRLDRYIANLLDMVRIEAGAIRLNLEPVDLVDAVAAALRDVRGGDAVQVDVPADLPLVRLDAQLFHHILINLIDNARRHGAGAPVTIAAARHGDGVTLAVCDAGPGLPPGSEARVFETFTRLEGSDRVGGTGLGLAIVKGFAEAMGLHVSAANRADTRGAAFTLELPAVLLVAVAP